MLKSLFSATYFLGVTAIIGLLLWTYYNIRVSENDVRQAAKLHGWASAKVEGFCWFGCRDGALFKTRATVTTNTSQTMQVCVCSGIFQGVSVNIMED